MNKQEFLNTKYLNLCQQLGDAQVKLDQLLEHVDNLKSEIKTLNKAFPLMMEHENLAKKEQKNV